MGAKYALIQPSADFLAPKLVLLRTTSKTNTIQQTAQKHRPQPIRSLTQASHDQYRPLRPTAASPLSHHAP